MTLFHQVTDVIFRSLSSKVTYRNSVNSGCCCSYGNGSLGNERELAAVWITFQDTNKLISVDFKMNV
jgi:hypothetical protein